MNNEWWVDPKELDEDQKAIVALDSNADYVVVGPPGCGKTNLLLLRANSLFLEEKRHICVLVFTRTLREFLASGATRYDFPVSKIKTYFNWAYDLFNEYGFEHKSSKDFMEERQLIIKDLEKVIEDNSLANVYDALFLDEANDYLVQEIAIFRILARRIFAVGDIRQQIYHREDTLGYLKGIVNETKVLKFHYRNGLNICKAADRISKDQSPEAMLEPTCHYKESLMKSTVKRWGGGSLERQLELVIKDLPNQMTVYPGEMIGITCPRKAQLPVVIDCLSRSPLAEYCTIQSPDTGYMTFSPERPICISTIYGSKGLEFRALHLVGADEIKGPQNRAVAYTAVTRTKTTLRIYHNLQLIGYLDGALAQFEQRHTPPTLNEIFGKGK